MHQDLLDCNQIKISIFGGDSALLTVISQMLIWSSEQLQLDLIVKEWQQ